MRFWRYLVAVAAVIWAVATGPAQAAFDAASRSGATWTTGVSSYSWSHTTAGSDRFLAVSVVTFNSGSRTVSGITYNGVALTKLGNITAAQEGNNQNFEIWYLFGPTVGTNSIQVTLSASTSFTMGMALSYTNIDSGAGIDSNNFAQILTATDTFSASTTVVSSQAYQVAFGWSRILGSPTAGASGTTVRQTTSDAMISGDSNGNVLTGSQSLGFFKSGANYWPAIGTFSIVTLTAEPQPVSVSKMVSGGVIETISMNASKTTSGLVISSSTDIWVPKFAAGLVITGEIDAALTETNAATDALQVFPAGGGGGGAAGIFGGGQDGANADFGGNGGFGGAADAFFTAAQLVAGATGNSGVEWNGVIGSGSGGSGGNYNPSGNGQNGGAGGSRGGGGGGGGGGTGTPGLGGQGGDGIIWIQYRSTSSGLLVEVTLASGSGSWLVPADWNDNDNRLALLGAGGCGSDASAFNGGNGGNGGSAVGGINISGLDPAMSIPYHINTAAEACNVTVVQTTFGASWAAGSGGNGGGGGGGGSATGAAAGGTFIYLPGLGGPGGKLFGLTITPNAGGLHPWQPLSHW